MFKPGDEAIVVANQKHVTVKSVFRGKKWNVETTDGVYDELELLQAHPTVLATAEAKPRDILAESAEDDDDDNLEKKVKSFELNRKVSDALKKANLELDVRGHWKNHISVYHRKNFEDELKFIGLLGGPAKEDLEALLQALTANKRLDKWVNLGRGMSSSECSYCGKGYFSLETDGKTLRLSGEYCANPEGFDLNEWELNVPSGKIVVENDLREWFPLPEGENFDVNGIIGCRLTSQAYAAAGMSHAFVGNTCPGVFRLGEGKFKIANEPTDERWDEEKNEYVSIDPPPEFEGERVTSVCTDLWWYSMCDLDEAVRRAEKFGGSTENLTVIDVKPGVYRFHHDDEVDRDTFETGVLYGTFEWVREPDPVKDFLKVYQEVDVNAHAYVQAKVKEWPTLYGTKRGAVSWSDMTDEQRASCWARVADQAFFTIGSGTDWHEKGFPTSKVDPGVQDIEPPAFREQRHWYPFSEGYGGIFGGVNLSPSFARLAFRCLESVISFGTDVRDGERCREVIYVRQRMFKAVEKYREMAKKYPDIADPDYVWWLSQEGRAEAWVENFDLGPIFTQKHRDSVTEQRWVPDDAYAVEFDARKLKDGHFAGKHGWSHKKNATGFAIEEWSDNEQEPEHNCFWTSHAIRTAVPLYSVARVVKVGEVSHMGKTLVELAYDYGTEWMKDVSVRKALNEMENKKAIRVLTKREYEKLLPEAEDFCSK
jgi:hypothetical protein